ncbi:MAG: hypothetical protein JO031_17045, partial [Ktedonobacteraceae bacterium]|nr:hypothetical protein [Ktedonobacteraceae bacterium]
MYEKRSKNVYGKFETASLGDALHPIAHTTDAPEHITTPHIEQEQSPVQVNRWIVFALAASSSFITTLDSSIVNIGLPAIS